MNSLDLFVLIMCLWLAFKGFKKGLIVELASLVALILGIYGAMHFSDTLSGFIIKWNVSEKFVPLVSFALTFLLIIVIITFIAKFIEKVIDLLALSFINKIGGGLFGALKGLLICTVIVVFINKLDQKIDFLDDGFTSDSFFFHPMVSFSENVFPGIMNEYFEKNEI